MAYHTVAGILAIFCLSAASDFEAYQSEQNKEFTRYQQHENAQIREIGEDFIRHQTLSAKDFVNWRENENRLLSQFIAAEEKKWGYGFKPDPKKWVWHAPDGESRAIADLEKGNLRIEVLREKSDSAATRAKIQKAIRHTLESKGSGDDRYHESKHAGPLSNQVINDNGSIIHASRIEAFAHQKSDEIIKQNAAAVSGISTKPVVVQIDLQLAPDHIRRRAEPLLPIIERYAARYNLNRAQVLATIHTESFFNPVARSSSNAIGLMQLVPEKGGRDAFRHVYGIDRIPLPHYLTDPEKNIELGCAYMYLLEKKHFAAIREQKSKRYCSIAGYNTGPGNVAIAFVGRLDLNAAIEAVNAIGDGRKVFAHMLGNLPYTETRGYLRDVVKNMALYGMNDP